MSKSSSLFGSGDSSVSSVDAPVSVEDVPVESVPSDLSRVVFSSGGSLSDLATKEVIASPAPVSAIPSYDSSLIGILAPSSSVEVSVLPAIERALASEVLNLTSTQVSKAHEIYGNLLQDVNDSVIYGGGFNLHNVDSSVLHDKIEERFNEIIFQKAIERDYDEERVFYSGDIENNSIKKLAFIIASSSIIEVDTDDFIYYKKMKAASEADLDNVALKKRCEASKTVVVAEAVLKELKDIMRQEEESFIAVVKEVLEATSTYVVSEPEGISSNELTSSEEDVAFLAVTESSSFSGCSSAFVPSSVAGTAPSSSVEGSNDDSTSTDAASAPVVSASTFKKHPDVNKEVVAVDSAENHRDMDCESYLVTRLNKVYDEWKSLSKDVDVNPLDIIKKFGGINSTTSCGPSVEAPEDVSLTGNFGSSLDSE